MFLGQDISKFHACAQIYMFMLRSTLCLDLCPFGPCAMPMFRSMCLCALCHFCMLRSTCPCFLCHVYAQIFVPMFRSMSLWAPCHAYVQIHVFMCSVPCLCAQIYMLVASAMCFYSPLSLDISLSCVLALVGGVQIQIPRSRPTSTHLGLYQRVWIISLHACVCLLASALYVYACLSRSWLCHALCPPWTCSCMVTSIPLVAYWDLTTCETHSRDVGFLDAHPFSGPCDVACHAYFVPPIQLSSLLCIIFACLPTCSCLSLCLLVSSSLIPTISYGFTLIFETRDPKSLFGIFLDSTCFIHTLI